MILQKGIDTLSKETSVLFYKFWAPWCGPCKIVNPMIESVKEEFMQVSFIDVNIEEEENKHLVETYGIMSIPTVVVVDHGIEVLRGTGIPGINGVMAELEKIVKGGDVLSR